MNDYDYAHVPPKQIPDNLIQQFTMGHIPVLMRYYNHTRSVAIHNTAKIYEETFKKLKDKTFKYYGGSAFIIADAMDKYPVEGKEILVFGLAGCNCEAIALWKKAKKVYVVDYNKPICDHDDIIVVTYGELKKLKKKFDCAISFSSFEHDGLGRYGDPIAPFADIMAMKAAKEYLVDDGIMFLGVPMGRDVLVWNAHRIYGKYRLPVFLSGWSLLDVYSLYEGNDIFQEKLGSYVQPLLILKKQKNISTSKSDNKNMLKNINILNVDNAHRTKNTIMLEQILTLIANFEALKETIAVGETDVVGAEQSPPPSPQLPCPLCRQRKTLSRAQNRLPCRSSWASSMRKGRRGAPSHHRFSACASPRSNR